MRTYRAFLSLGSNLGNRKENLQRAVEALAAHPGIRLAASSSIYETEPVGFRDQPRFLNSVIEVETELSPGELLDVAHGIENDMGRVRTFKWGPRVIDVDILIYDGACEDSEKVIIPHPRMLERAFVLAPLAEIAPNLEIADGIRAAQALEVLSEEEKRGVRIADCD